MRIQISRGTKFHLKLTILNFGTKITQKGYFWWERESKRHWILDIQIILGAKLKLN